MPSAGVEQEQHVGEALGTNNPQQNRDTIVIVVAIDTTTVIIITSVSLFVGNNAIGFLLASPPHFHRVIVGGVVSGAVFLVALALLLSWFSRRSESSLHKRDR